VEILDDRLKSKEEPAVDLPPGHPGIVAPDKKK